MTPGEFASVLLWIMAPPLLLGAALIRLIWLRSGLSCHRCYWFAVLILFVFTVLFVTAFAAFDSQLPWLKVRDMDIFGFHTVWAPFAFVAVVLAFPFATWRLALLKRKINRLTIKAKA